MPLPAEAVRALLLSAPPAAVGLALWRTLVRRTGWAPVPVLLLILSLALCLGMTLPGTAGAGAAGRLGRCLADPAGRMAWSVRHFGDRGLEDVMNVALWAPPGLFGALATRRPFVAAAVVAGAFVVVEFLQALDPGRECDPGDWAYNTAGVLAGALAVPAARGVRRILRA